LGGRNDLRRRSARAAVVSSFTFDGALGQPARGFVLGLALIAPIALEAVWDAVPDRRNSLALRWAFFAVGALAASCCTPYGWNSLLGAARILDLGGLLSIISEWRPADFSSFGFFEACLLGLVGLAFRRGLVLSFPRIVLLLGLIYMALTHV
jgi:hypothetical protein